MEFGVKLEACKTYNRMLLFWNRERCGSVVDAAAQFSTGCILGQYPSVFSSQTGLALMLLPWCIVPVSGLVAMLNALVLL